MIGSWYADADYWSMAGTVAPEVVTLDVELHSGRTLRVDIDRQRHVFVLFSRTPLRVKVIRADAGRALSITCKPDEEEEEEDGFGLAGLLCSSRSGSRRSLTEGRVVR